MQNSHVYGVVDKNLNHIDVSKTERGAKQYATRNGYDTVSLRYGMNYIVKVVAEKINGKWVKAE